MLHHIRRAVSHQTIRYVAAGATTYFVEVSSFLLFYYAFRIESGLANACSLLLAWVVNYLLAHHFVFTEYDRSAKRSLPRYVMLASFNLVCSSLVVAFLVGHVGLKAYIVKPIVSALIAVWTYFAYKYFVFRKA